MSNLAFAKFNANGEDQFVFTHFKTDLRATSNTCIVDFSLSHSTTAQSDIKVMRKKKTISKKCIRTVKQILPNGTIRNV